LEKKGGMKGGLLSTNRWLQREKAWRGDTKKKKIQLHLARKEYRLFHGRGGACTEEEKKKAKIYTNKIPYLEKRGAEEHLSKGGGGICHTISIPIRIGGGKEEK